MLKPKKGDILVITLVVLAALGLWLSNIYLVTGQNQNYITVHVNNRLVAEFSFDNETHEIIDIPLENGYTAQVEIEQGRVRVLPMEREVCPLGICSSTGWIEKSYETIVCLPNRMVVSFSAHSQQDDDMDIISY